MVTRGGLFEAIAARPLRPLAEHRFAHWPEDADLVLNPMTTAMSTYLTEQASSAPQPTNAPDRSLRALYALWREQRRMAKDEALKFTGEWLLAVHRFEDLIGTKPGDGCHHPGCPLVPGPVL